MIDLYTSGTAPVDRAPRTHPIGALVPRLPRKG